MAQKKRAVAIHVSYSTYVELVVAHRQIVGGVILVQRQKRVLRLVLAAGGVLEEVIVRACRETT